MNLYGIPSIVACVFTLTLGTFVYLKNTRSLVNISFFVWLLTLTVWHFGSAWTYFVSTPAFGLLASRLTHAGAILIPSAFLHFILSFLKLNEKRSFLIVLGYLISLILEIANLTPFFIRGAARLSYNYYGVPGVLYPTFVLFFFAVVVYCHVCLYQFLTRAVGRKRTQLKYLFIASVIGYSGGAVDFLPIFGIDVYAIGNSVNILFVSLVAYAILRHNLMDIEVVVKKTLVFAGLFGMVMAVVAGVTTVTQSLIAYTLDVPLAISTAISVLVAILLYDPTRQLLVRVTDRYLFQRKYDIRGIITQLASRSVEILDMDRLAREIVETLVSAMNLHSACVAILDEKEKNFQLIHSYGLGEVKEGIPEDDFLIRYLGRTKEILNLEDQESGRFPLLLRSRMERLHAVISIPLFIRDELVGLITLGKKKSDAEYTQEDFDYFALFQSQLAVALSNARLYSILNKSRLEFAQQAKMAAIGILSQGINHQVRNPLTIIKGKAQVLQMNLRDGIYNGKSREELLRLIKEMTSVAIESADRASDIMVRLSSFARPTHEDLNQEVDLKKELDEIFPFVEKQLELSNIRYDIESPSSLPHVLGDGKEIGEVFLNLINNAYQAILQKDKENRRASGETIGTLRIRAERENGFVLVHFEDTGVGIPEDKLEEIYTPFYTTKVDARTKDPHAVTGTGLGLYVCREIIEHHQGKIRVRSKVGEGTTFTLIFTRLAHPVEAQTKSN